MKMQYEIHPLCATSNDMLEDDFKKLKEDINQNGLVNPIILCNGRIIDGRHRARAMHELGFKLEDHDIIEIRPDSTDDEIRKSILSYNEHRRHESPQARIASQERLAGKARKQGRQKGVESTPLPKTRKEIAKAAGVSETQVDQHRKVQKDAIEPIKKALKNDAISLEVAAKASRLPKSKQEAIAAKGPEAIKEAAKQLSKPAPRPEAPPLGAAAYLSGPTPAAPEPERRDMAGHKTSGGIRSFVQGYLSADQMKDFETLLADEEANFRNRVLAEVALLGETNKVKWNTPPPPAPRIILDAVNAAIRAMK